MNKDLKTEFQLTYDSGDAWGSCMQWLFAVCDYLTFETDDFMDWFRSLDHQYIFIDTHLKQLLDE